MDIVAVAVYLLSLLCIESYGFYIFYTCSLTQINIQASSLFLSMLSGGIGGIVYCIRGVYLNKCVHRTWSPEWYTWYALRPIVSVVIGGVAYFFLSSGLLLLNVKGLDIDSRNGLVSLAFVAGLNVDGFVKKIESITKSLYGIDKSKVSSNDSHKPTIE